MEFFPGAFEREWERRRAMLMHEMHLGQLEKSAWEEPRRGGVVWLPDEGLGAFGRARRSVGGSRLRRTDGSGGSADRSMRTRFAALARGSQPAVVKLASYGGGARAASMISYTSRGGELAVENERGERLLGRAALAEQTAEWEHLFDRHQVRKICARMTTGSIVRHGFRLKPAGPISRSTSRVCVGSNFRLKRVASVIATTGNGRGRTCWMNGLTPNFLRRTAQMIERTGSYRSPFWRSPLLAH